MQMSWEIEVIIIQKYPTVKLQFYIFPVNRNAVIKTKLLDELNN